MLENGVLSRKRQRYCSLAVVIHTSTRMGYQFREAVHMQSQPVVGGSPVLSGGHKYRTRWPTRRNSIMEGLTRKQSAVSGTRSSLLLWFCHKVR